MALLDYFLTVKLKNAGQVKGEVVSRGFEDHIEIQSYSWGEVFGEGQAGQTGRVQMQNFHFCMAANRASAPLMQACAKGDPLVEAVLKCCREAAGGKQVFMTWTLKDGVVASYHTGGGSGDIMPTDMFELKFKSIAVEYKPKCPDGSLGAALTGQHDLGQGK
jgi:type VI secretion system secreted protein Hcp